MSIRELLMRASEHGMRIQFSREKPGICAVICKVCGYGDGLFDQRATGYEVDPYSCPRYLTNYSVVAL